MQVQTKRWEEVDGPNRGVGFFSLINGIIHYETKKTYCGGSRLRRIQKTAVWQTKNQTTNIPLTLVLLLYAQL
jgi:hypothetical protein